MEHIAIRIEDDDEMENEEYVRETVQRIRRRSLVKVVGGCLLFGSGIFVGAASNMMIINDANHRELKIGAFIAKQIAKRGGAAAVKKMIGEKAALFAVKKVGGIAGTKGAGLFGIKGADYQYGVADATPAPEYYPMGLGDKVYIPPVPKGQELDSNTPTGVGLFVPP